MLSFISQFQKLVIGEAPLGAVNNILLLFIIIIIIIAFMLCERSPDIWGQMSPLYFRT